jgi:hypothetical protein
MKIPSLFIIFLITLSLCACENHWMKDILQTITITFDTDGGSEVSRQILHKGEKVKIPDNPTKVNNGTVSMYFYGWYINKQGNENNPPSEDEKSKKLYDFNSVPVNDMTLYAWWVSNP